MNIDATKFIADFKHNFIMREYGKITDIKMSADFEERSLIAYRSNALFAAEIDGAVSHTLDLLMKSRI